MVSEIEWLAQRLRVPGHAERIRDIALRIARGSPGKAVPALAEAVASRIAEFSGQAADSTQASINDAVSLLRLALEGETRGETSNAR